MNKKLMENIPEDEYKASKAFDEKKQNTKKLDFHGQIILD